jgi:CRISPR type II-A-associated protein Csn2
MIRFRYKSIQKEFALGPGDVLDLTIENPLLLYTFVRDLKNDEELAFSLSEDGKDIEFNKTVLVITDLFSLDPNSKKVLAAIYKKIDRTCLNPERRAQFDQINQKINALMSEIASDFDDGISFNDALTLPQILGLIDFKFDFDDSSFLTSLLSYIKAWRETINLKLVVAPHAFSLLSSSDLAVFQKELSYLGLSFLNISSKSIVESNENVNKTIIDNDLCIID